MFTLERIRARELGQATEMVTPIIGTSEELPTALQLMRQMIEDGAATPKDAAEIVSALFEKARGQA